MKVFWKAEKYVNYDESFESSDEFDRADTYTDWYFSDKAYLNRDDVGSYRFETGYIETDKEIKSGDTVYFVVVIWSDGDSFGHDSDYNAEAVALYTNEDDAYKAKSIVEKAEVSCVLPDGYELKYLPWNGYFEDFSYAQVVQAKVQ